MTDVVTKEKTLTEEEEEENILMLQLAYLEIKTFNCSRISNSSENTFYGFI